MKEDASFFDIPLDEVDCFFELALREAVEGSLLKDTTDVPVRPFLCYVNSLPVYPSLEIPFLTLFLVDESPTKIRANQVLIAPSVE